MNLDEMLNKINDLNDKEDFAKKQQKEEMNYNLKKDYKEAKERFEEELKDSRIKNVIKIFRGVRELPRGWDYASSPYDEPLEFRGKKLYKMLIPEYRVTNAKLNENKICFCVMGKTINGVSDSALCYRWQEKPTYDSNGVYHEIYDKIFVSVSVNNKDEVVAHISYGDWWYHKAKASLDGDDLNEKYLGYKTRAMNQFCDQLDDFINEATIALSDYINEKELEYGNVDIHEKKDFKLKRLENELNQYSLYCKTYDKTYYLSAYGESLFAVDNTLTKLEAVVLMKNAVEYNIEDEKAKVCVFATDNRNRERLEDMWQDYIDNEDDFVAISEEFEEGVQQYKEELGIDLDDELEL